MASSHAEIFGLLRTEIVAIFNDELEGQHA